MLVSTSYDSTIRLWNINTGKQIHILEGDTHTIHSVVFSPQSNVLAGTANDGTILLWETKTGEQIHKFTGHQQRVYFAAFSPDQQTLISQNMDKAILWSVKTGKQLQVYEGRIIISLDWRSTGKYGAEQNPVVGYENRKAG